MKKKLLLILISVIFVFTCLSAQKIEYNKKKELILIDKVEVARLELSKDAKQHLVYTFTDLNSDATLVLTGVTPEKNPEAYTVSSTLSDRKSEMPFEMVGFTLSPTTAILNLIVKKYQFFSISGMNQKAITDFLYVEKRDYSAANEKAAEKSAMMQQKVDSLAPVFEGNRVLSKNTGELLAVFENTNNGFLIKDEKNNLIGKAKENVMEVGPIRTVTYILSTFDNKEYELKADQLAAAKTSAINCLITYDYLGKGKNSYVLKKTQLDALESQHNKMRITFNKGKSVHGIMVLEDGKTIKGNFEIDFRAVMPDGTIYPFDDIGIMAPRYKNAEHHYIDEKQKIRKKNYSERQIRSFTVKDSTNPENEEFYCKISYQVGQARETGKTSGLLKLGGLTSSKPIEILAYRISDLPKTTLYAGNQRYFVVDKKVDATVKELDPKIYRDQLKLITADCPSLEKKVEACEYTRASIVQLIKEYNNCK